MYLDLWVTKQGRRCKAFLLNKDMVQKLRCWYIFFKIMIFLLDLGKAFS